MVALNIILHTCATVHFSISQVVALVDIALFSTPPPGVSAVHVWIPLVLAQPSGLGPRYPRAAARLLLFAGSMDEKKD